MGVPVAPSAVAQASELSTAQSLLGRLSLSSAQALRATPAQRSLVSLRTGPLETPLLRQSQGRPAFHVRASDGNGTPSCGIGPLAPILQETSSEEILELEVEEAKGNEGAVTLGLGDDPRSVPVAAALELGNSRGELKRSLKEGIMPPWRQEGVLLDVSKMSNDMLVSADAVYNKELR